MSMHYHPSSSVCRSIFTFIVPPHTWRSPSPSAKKLQPERGPSSASLITSLRPSWPSSIYPALRSSYSSSKYARPALRYSSGMFNLKGHVFFRQTKRNKALLRGWKWVSIVVHKIKKSLVAFTLLLHFFENIHLPPHHLSYSFHTISTS